MLSTGLALLLASVILIGMAIHDFKNTSNRR